jgi:CheY-like chemotaxis protein
LKNFKNILIIDDDFVSLSLTMDELIEARMAENIDLAFNGEEGLKIVQEYQQNTENLELIILDINMPIMDGFQFLEKLNEMDIERKPKVIMLSSSYHPNDFERSQALDAVGYIVKPFSTYKLNFALRHRSAQN